MELVPGSEDRDMATEQPATHPPGKPARGKSLVQSGVILVCLLGVGWYGHHSHWSLPFLSKHEPEAAPHANSDHAEASTSASVEIRSLGNGELEFPNADAMQLIGLTTDEVTRK